MRGVRVSIWMVRQRVRVARVLAGCCAALWLVGSLPVVQGNLTPQWTMPHCPQGHTSNSAQSHHHCAWHCGGIDTTDGGVRSGLFVVDPVGARWNFDANARRVTVAYAEMVPRGPPAGMGV